MAKRIRKDFETLTNEEKSEFIQAILDLKHNGQYDELVLLHQQAMDNPTPWQNAAPDTRRRNAAHRGPAFLPWHRHYLLLFENALREVSGNDNLALPYWNWLADGMFADPTQAPIWTPVDPGNPDPTTYIGGNGDPNQNWVVTDGPFAHWPLVHNTGAPPNELQRKFGAKPEIGLPSVRLPTLNQNCSTSAAGGYDSVPWDVSASGFRGFLEGFPGPATEPGPYMHNVVHVWVGGSMLPGTSPNDPVFYLNHCFVDKLWADWQRRQRDQIFGQDVFYAPLQDGPLGHNVSDAMFPWNTAGDSVTPEDNLDHHALGYHYDTEPEALEEAVAPPTEVARELRERLRVFVD